MHRRLPAIAMASVPFFCSLALWGAWHFWLVPVLFPFSLALLAFPACLGFAAVLASEPHSSAVTARPSKRPVALAAVAAYAVAYACALYAWSSMLGLLPEHYKFSANTVSLSRGTIEMWAALSAATVVVAVVVRRTALTGSLSRKLATSIIGMSCATAVLFGSFLAAGLASYRP
jgi:hypothetical protein